MTPIFITGIGTGVGKTLIAALVTEALQADYWKPVQAGFDDGTDALGVQQMISNAVTKIHPEVYKLQLPASPHIAAREENITIRLEAIAAAMPVTSNKYLVIEGAGGLMVPLNENEFILHLIKKLNAAVLLVSRNYLGSINHSLLTAAICRHEGLNVKGWIFNDQYMQYEQEIAQWSGYPAIASVPLLPALTKENIQLQAQQLKPLLQQYL